MTWTALGNNVAVPLLGLTFLPTVPWAVVLVGWLLLVSPFGRMGLSAAGARLLLAQVQPGTYPRGGRVHLRVWLAERLADECGATNLSGAPWFLSYARALGASDWQMIKCVVRRSTSKRRSALLQSALLPAHADPARSVSSANDGDRLNFDQELWDGKVLRRDQRTCRESALEDFRSGF